MSRYMNPRYAFPAGMLATGYLLLLTGHPQLAPRYFVLAGLGALVMYLLRRCGI